MKRNDEIIHLEELQVREMSEDGGCGLLFLGTRHLNKAAFVVWSWGGGWDHVSISYRNRVPTWDEMCKVKDLFFDPEETCVEYHPARSEYVNCMPYCLHIWRWQDGDMPKPPKILV